MPPAVTLKGCRVRLEPLSLSHVSALVQAATEARDSYDFTLVPAEDAAMARYVQAVLADQGTGWALPFAIYDLRSQAIIGSTRFLDLDYWSWPPAWPPGRTTPRPHAIPTVAEIGSTWLAPSAQRTGCNTESKLLMLSHAFDTWGVLRVTLKTDSRNTRSRRAIERIGGRFEGIRRAHARAVDGSVRDTAYYSIVAAEWPDVRAALKARVTALLPYRKPATAQPVAMVHACLNCRLCLLPARSLALGAFCASRGFGPVDGLHRSAEPAAAAASGCRPLGGDRGARLGRGTDGAGRGPDAESVGRRLA
jgi:RimJ/RimL family protein N-acetyltransferase